MVFAWSGTYLVASALTAAQAVSAALIAASAGPFWLAHAAANATASASADNVINLFMNASSNGT
jgi:hypothetical protein